MANKIGSKNLRDDDAKAWRDYVEHFHHRPIALASMKRPDNRSEPRPRVLDLHGLTLQQAHASTIAFLESHRLAKTTEIIIICGKGGRISDELPHWCELSGLTRSCRPITDSKGEHGAYSVRLKKE